MADLPKLSGPSVPPASGNAPRQLVILLHGVGADGNDLIGLAPAFQQILPDAAFVSPNAPFAFDMAPYGYQWFSIKDFSSEARLQGAQIAAPILVAYIDYMLALFGLAEDRLALVGFSQGTMMSLYVGLRRAKPVAGIVGYSGMLVGADRLKSEIKSRPPVLLVHGDADQVLPVESLPAAVKGLQEAGVTVESHIRPGLGHGIDDEGIRLGQKFLAKVFKDAGDA
jgi:phospholipase/carboxylesterase